MCQICGFGVTGGMGIPPQLPIQRGAISNTISKTVISFCRPTPGVRFHKNSEPPFLVDGCGVFTRNLDTFPLNQPTLWEGDYITFGSSEMVLVFVKVEQYAPGSYITIRFKHPDGTVFFTTTTNLPTPDPNWSWWNGWAWGVVGRFDNTSGYSGDEIIAPGQYTIDVLTNYGTAVIDYQVTGCAGAPGGITHKCASHNSISLWNESTCNYETSVCPTGTCDYTTGWCTDPDMGMPVIWEVIGPGSFYVYKNDALLFTVYEGMNRTAAYKIGDTIGWVAYPQTNGEVVNVCDSSGICDTQPSYSYQVVGQLPQKMIATFREKCLSDTWVCEVPANGYEVNGCGDRRQAARCEPGPEPGVTILESDKGSYKDTETPVFTVRYSPSWIGKEVILSRQEATGGYTSVAQATANSQGVTTFTYKPSNAGNHTFVAQITPCAIILNCSTSNKVTISITGDLPCNPLDPLCNVGKVDWVPIAAIGAGVYLLGQLIGGRR